MAAKNWIRRTCAGIGIAAVVALSLAVVRAARKPRSVAAESKDTAAAALRPRPKPQPSATGHVVKNGLAVDFSIAPVGRGSREGEPLVVGDFAELTFRLSDPDTGAPARASEPAAWMDIGDRLPSPDREKQGCKEKVSLYLRGLVGMRPMLDLNSYYLLVLNQDPSISVIDPIVSMTGMTSLYATAVLERPPADWTRSRDEKRIYVSMPTANKVAVVDTDSFKVAANVATAASPLRVALQSDGRYLWVGNDAEDPAESGVTVVDTVKLEAAARITTGRGHHEIAFSAGDRYAFVTNRKDGTVSVVDVARLRKVKDLTTGPVPLAISYSPLSREIYVADGKDGTIAVIDGSSLAVVTKIRAKPGLGPMRFSPDGRFGLVVNTVENAVHVVDAGDNRLVHTIPMRGQPYQVAFTRAFAYVRLLDSENVQMVNLLTLGVGKQPVVKELPVGTMAPKLAGDLSIADAISPASTDAAVFVTDPVESRIYFYMEGMNAPMGNFGNYGHRARAVGIADRSLKQVEPGLYSGVVRIPAAGRYDVAFLSQSPPLVHCFSVEAKEDPNRREKRKPVEIKYVEPSSVAAPGMVPLRFRLADGASHEPRKGLADVNVRYYLVPGDFHRDVAAREVEAGLYEAKLDVTRPGAYYAHVSIPSLKVRLGDLPFRSLRIEVGKPAAVAGKEVSRVDK
jgi:YVTN family beta-propeller protein